MILFFLPLRPPSVDPFRVGFPLMMPRMYHRPYCKELLGLPAGPDSAKARDDPEGYFTRCPHHISDTRMDPKIIDETGMSVPFWQIRKGDIVNVRVAVETRWGNRRQIRIHLGLKRVTVLERSIQEGPQHMMPSRLTFVEKSLKINEPDL